MEYLKVSDAGDAPLHATEPGSVAVDYAQVALARTKALQAFARAQSPSGATEAERIEALEGGVRELSDAVHALVAVLTEIVSGLGVRDVHVVNYPDERELLGQPGTARVVDQPGAPV